MSLALKWSQEAFPSEIAPPSEADIPRTNTHRLALTITWASGISFPLFVRLHDRLGDTCLENEKILRRQVLRSLERGAMTSLGALACIQSLNALYIRLAYCAQRKMLYLSEETAQLL